MRTLVHDLEPDELRRILGLLPGDIKVIEKGEREPAPCVGCFGCWTKTPGHCVIRDEWGDFSAQLGKSDEYILVTRVTYGGYSPFPKAVFDRNIGYFLPFFTIRNGEMHHTTRYGKGPKTIIVGYGETTEGERETFRGVAIANGVNLDARETVVHFLDTPEQLREVLA